MTLKEPELVWMGEKPTPESRFVVEEFRNALEALRNDHPEMFVHLVRVCHDNTHNVPSKALGDLLKEGFLKEDEEGKIIPFSSTLRNVVLATASSQEDGEI